MTSLIVPSAFDAAPTARSLVLGGKGGFERRPVELPGLGDERDHHQRHPALPRQRLPGSHVRVVVELRDHDLVARLPGAAEGPRQVEGQGRHVGAEGDLLGRAPEKVGECRPASPIIASVSTLLGYRQCVFALWW